MRIALYVLPLLLMVYAIIDCAADDDVERTSVPKVLWILIIILLPVVGSIAWLAVAKIARPRTRPVVRGSGGPLPHRSPRRTGPLAPDDNPDYLRRLADEQARRERERRRKQERGEEPGASPTNTA